MRTEFGIPGSEIGSVTTDRHAGAVAGFGGDGTRNPSLASCDKMGSGFCPRSGAADSSGMTESGCSLTPMIVIPDVRSAIRIRFCLGWYPNRFRVPLPLRASGPGTTRDWLVIPDARSATRNRFRRSGCCADTIDSRHPRRSRCEPPQPAPGLIREVRVCSPPNAVGICLR